MEATLEMAVASEHGVIAARLIVRLGDMLKPADSE
jgi:hypothetical protein